MAHEKSSVLSQPAEDEDAQVIDFDLTPLNESVSRGFPTSRGNWQGIFYIRNGLLSLSGKLLHLLNHHYGKQVKELREIVGSHRDIALRFHHAPGSWTTTCFPAELAWGTRIWFLSEGSDANCRSVVHLIGEAEETSGPVLTRISHHPSATAADAPAVSSRSSRHNPQRYVNTASGCSGPGGLTHQGLDDFATMSGEKSGLNRALRVLFAIPGRQSGTDFGHWNGLARYVGKILHSECIGAVHVLPDPSERDFQDALASGDYNALHLVGHGDFDSSGPYLKYSDWKLRPRHILGPKPPPLVFIHACDVGAHFGAHLTGGAGAEARCVIGFRTPVPPHASSRAVEV